MDIACDSRIELFEEDLPDTNTIPRTALPSLSDLLGIVQTIMYRMLASLLLAGLVLHVACATATTYAIYSYYAGTNCDGTPFGVYASEETDCTTSVCSAYGGNSSSNGTIVDRTTVECTSDYLSGIRNKFSSTAYIIGVKYNEEDCSTVNYAYGETAFGNCEGSFQEGNNIYIIGMLNNNGSATIKYYDDNQCLTEPNTVGSVTKEALTTHSCDEYWTKWYSSKDNTSTALTQASSSTRHDTGATVGLICGVVILLLVIGAVIFYRRRRSRGKHGGQWKVALPSGAISGQSGLWNDDVITAKRIPCDKVKIMKLISQGAYGEVYNGVFNGRQVAVKILLPSTRGNLQHVTDFLTEAKLTASMDHPHIVTFVGVAWDSLSDLCVVWEFMDGGDLRTLLNKYEATKHPVGVDREKATIALHVCHALTYLHSLMPPVIHRDLKSRNILLNQKREAKLTDFGTSRERIDKTMTAGVGTPLWMAPEVMLVEKYDVKDDVLVLCGLVGVGRPHSAIRPSEAAKRQFGRSPDFGHNFAAEDHSRRSLSCVFKRKSCFVGRVGLWLR